MYSNPGSTHRQALEKLADLPDDAKTIGKDPQMVVIDKSKLQPLRTERIEDATKHVE
jgi:hypothetical protein